MSQHFSWKWKRSHSASVSACQHGLGMMAMTADGEAATHSHWLPKSTPWKKPTVILEQRIETFMKERLRKHVCRRYLSKSHFEHPLNKATDYWGMEFQGRGRKKDGKNQSILLPTEPRALGENENSCACMGNPTSWWRIPGSLLHWLLCRSELWPK